MNLFVGLDVSVRMTSVCVMEVNGKVLKEAKVESEPQAIASLLGSLAGQYRRVGLEAGLLAQWLYSGLAAAGFPIICVETRHMKAALSAQINKTDRNDARGIAQMMRVRLFCPVHVKTERSQEIRMLLTARKFLQLKIIDAENSPRGMLRNFGLKVGAVTRLQFEARVIELIEARPHLTITIAPLLKVRRVLREQYQFLHKAIERLAADDGICRLLMTAPGLGPLVSLTFRAGIDEAARLSRSRSVPAQFGLTPASCQSGELDRGWGISMCGDSGVRWALVEAAGIIMRQKTKSSPLKVWGTALAKHRGPAKALVAVARRLATILHRMWIDNTEYRWQAQPAESVRSFVYE
ncbi:IS110 family transposase [Paracoccus sp. SM22M-07]|uniref:IS110 family transposase n=1 Tax=Paracoccus sp. SM22M-07 TaxID=1520813 RepID=UPI0009141B48|nr:IS110 family transposase [Paracoccus sp. SM22M-07]OJH43083.1 transposase [Paracoccus sp. SM22M-07]